MTSSVLTPPSGTDTPPEQPSGTGRAVPASHMNFLIANGAVMVRKPVAPSSRFYRLFCISKDDGDAGDIYVARFFPRAKVTSFAEQAFGGGDDPITWGVTMTGYADSDLQIIPASAFR